MPASMSHGTVALLGTGTMGAPMARNLAQAELPVVVWNRSTAKAEALAADGIRVAASPRDAIAEADMLITMLADGPVIESVLRADDALAAARPSAAWIQMSTVGAAGADRLAALAAEHEIEFVDAPVLGSSEPAVRGELVILASGPDEARERYASVFEALGSRTVWLGPAGAGSRLKVVVNAWLMAMTATLGETFALSEKLGVNFEWFFDVTDRGAMAGLYTELNGSAMVAREFPVNFPLELATKDTALALEAAGEEGTLLVLEATLRQFERAEELGLGKSDWAAVVRVVAGDDSADSPPPA